MSSSVKLLRINPNVDYRALNRGWKVHIPEPLFELVKVAAD